MRPGRAAHLVALFASAFCIASPANASSILGNTPEQVHSRFTSIVEFNIQREPAVVDRLTDQELADFAYVYGIRNSGDFDALSRTFARRLSPTSLVRLAPYVGADNMRRAIERYAEPTVAQSYEALVSLKIQC